MLRSFCEEYYAAKRKASKECKFLRIYMLPVLSNLGFLANSSKSVDSPSNILSKVKSPTQSAPNNTI